MPDFPPETVAFITGAASGIGLSVALQLVADGVSQIALIDLSETSLGTAVEIITATNSTISILVITANCSIEEDVDKAVATTVSKFGRLDIAFNGAGISGITKPTENLEVSELEKVLDVNLKGLWLCERAIIRQMLKQEERPVSTGLPLKTRGSIVNAGSVASHLGLRNLGPYIMAKHAVLGLTRGDAVDHATAGIRVNCVCPGWIKTAMTKRAWGDSNISEVVAKRAPMERWGLPEEVAYTISFLLSDKASFITGASISVDGGLTAC